MGETPITSLPEGLTVGGWLDLSGTPITSLPQGLTVGGGLYLSGTQITSLPEGLTVGGGLDLRGTQIKSLPEGLTVGGGLYLRGTQITSLPEGLTVGGGLDLRGTQISNPDHYTRLKNGDMVDGKYIYCDDMLVHIKRKKKIGDYTFYIGKIKGLNVLYDGENYAHCKSFRDGVNDIEFKKAKDRGADQYKDFTMETVVTADEAKMMYRIITGACKAGTEHFVNGLQSIKKKYTVRELIDITEGQYRSEVFKAFFAKSTKG